MARVFICYSSADSALKDEVEGHLQNLGGLGIDPWSDSQIAGGQDWKAEIQAAIEACDAAILLVSRTFLNSPFIKSVEVPALLKARNDRNAVVIPVIARACVWTRIDWLAAMQIRPVGGKDLRNMNTGKRDIALRDLALEIEHLTQSPARPVPPANGAESRTVEITIDGTLDHTDDELMALIQHALETASQSKEVTIRRRRKGSLKLVVTLPADALGRLQSALERGVFDPPGLRITDSAAEIDLFRFRGHPVMLDDTLASFFDRPVKHVNQARDRNADRFDEGYAFQLTAQEWADLKSQIVTAKKGRGGRRTPPWVYTEKGAAMLATVLRTPIAVQASKLIVETFVAARKQAQAVPPGNHDGIGDPDAENDAKRAFKARLKGYGGD